MYLTHIIDDFNFEDFVETDEVLYTLKFEQIKIKIVFPFFKSKVLFHNNQGRNCSLLWSHTLHGTVKNYIFRVENIVEFYWDKGSNVIKYKYLKYADKKLVHYWLLHTFLPLYYTLENVYEILHVGAVAINEKVCLFAAPSFGGKSTLTHYFLEKGHQLFSDDKLALFKRDNVYFAAPSYPYVRNYRKYENLGEFRRNFSEKSLVVGCIYKLIQVAEDDEIKIEEVRGVHKFSIIEMSSDIKLSFLKKEKFSHLHDLAENLTIYTITIPQNLNRLEEVYKKIIEHTL